MLNKILDSIKFTRSFVRKSQMTSGNEYEIKLSRNGYTATFRFHDNYMNKSTLKDWIYCLVMDMNAFEFSRDVYDFARDYGYADEDIKTARKAYNACKITARKLHKLFSETELEILSELR